MDQHVITGELKNGLKYYIRPNGKPEQRVEFRLVVNAGSILEDDDQQGLAHFLEHMAFNGTADFSKNDLISFLEQSGVDFGAEWHGDVTRRRSAVLAMRSELKRRFPRTGI